MCLGSRMNNPSAMPPPDEVPATTRLRVLIEGAPTVTSIDIRPGMDVFDITEDLYRKREGLPSLKNATLETMGLWKVDINLELYRNDVDALSALKADASGEKLIQWDFVSRLWPCQPASSKLNIIVKVLAGIPMENLRTLKRLLDLSEVQEFQAKRHRTAETPSGVCKSAKSMQKAQDFSEVLNGRPWDVSGPPVGLFHPIFDHFMDYFNDPSPNYRTASSAADVDKTMPLTDEVFAFMRACSEFYEEEQSQKDENSGRMEAISPALRRLLGVDLLWVRNVDQMKSDAQVTTPTHINGINGLMAVLEVKLEPGIGGDAETQTQRSYGRTCSLSTYSPIRTRSCCPCFLIGISGPWITVLGAVYVQKVLVQHLVGPLYLPPQLLHPTRMVDEALRLFYALRRSLSELRDHYENLPLQVTNSRLFPHAQSYVDLTGITMNLDYVTLLSGESRAVYLAKVDDRDVVVKFVSAYSMCAHTLLAERGLAPEIIYDGTVADKPRHGGLSMIVMEHVKGETLTQYLQSSPPPSQERLDAVLKSVTTALELLHAKDLVFGDLRTPNILVGEDDSVKLIDFDWTGVDGKHQYPFIVGNGIEWAKGVGPLAIMYKEHDIFMLESLKEHVQRGDDDPGVW